MPTIESCGSTLFYQLTGAGAPVLLVHSSACRGGFWRGLVEHLADGFACYTPDLAGYGRSRYASMNSKAALRDEAEFIAPLLWHDTQRFHLVGHSFGGAVALAAALAWPDRVRSLTLYEPTAFSVLRNGSSEDRALFETVASVPAEMRRLHDAGSDDAAMGCFVDFWNGSPVWGDKPAAERGQLSRLAGKVIEDFRLLFEASFAAHDLARVQCPVLILRRDQAPPVAARVAEVLAALIGHARLETIPGVGHMAPVTDPGRIAAAITHHIRTAGARAGRSERHSAQHELQHGR
jgi:pimeloyl-ACP methyl ester carboxylesterase